MKQYQVNKITETLAIKGEARSLFWDKAEVLSDFSLAWNSEHAQATEFRALYNDQHFFFRFDVEDDHVLTFIEQDHKLEVVDSDRVEIFFRKNDQLKPYYCLEMDARGRVLDYEANYYRDFDYEWNWPGDLDVKASENSKGYVVEGAISLQSLRNLGILKENKIEAGLYRGFCTHLPDKNRGAGFKWISWVKPDSAKPDFHIPSSFGVLNLEK
ncbi:carbohydrate-binding family 9-like protein [Marinifilum caeruleilacunae]|uniref:Endoxylanase n=1 Tax=Marinifilum caeruleilacunae TaxID=2499076 RepID=A0ABX1WUZ5_9BACT|nr:carbohydrate-binding family 9-like protein [Marinifilum caeruleilacunae]NOU59735.1 endoxylanase [Marinifilum caeruleilacunae]